MRVTENQEQPKPGVSFLGSVLASVFALLLVENIRKRSDAITVTVKEPT